MRAIFAAAFLVLAVPAVSAQPMTSITPSYDDCTTPSLHGVWDCR